MECLCSCSLFAKIHTSLLPVHRYRISHRDLSLVTLYICNIIIVHSDFRTFFRVFVFVNIQILTVEVLEMINKLNYKKYT